MNDTMQFTYEGTHYLFVRDGEVATSIEVHQDSTYVGTVHYTWASSEPVTATFSRGTTWVTANLSTGFTEDASEELENPECWCPPDEPCAPCAELQTGDCEDEQQAMQTAAWEAVAEGSLAAVTSNTPIGLGILARFAFKTGWAIGKAILWAECKVTSTSLIASADYGLVSMPLDSQACTRSSLPAFASERRVLVS